METPDFIIKKGESVEIVFPPTTNVVDFTGEFTCKKSENKISHEKWSTLEGSIECPATKVYAAHHDALFVASDNSIWGIGTHA